MKCRSCGGVINQFFSLGNLPLVNSFLKKSEIKSEEKFDLSLSYCQHCSLVQLSKSVPPNKMFDDYIYFSSVSQSILDHAARTSEHLIKHLEIPQKSLVVEIASNDGYLLKFFRKNKMQVFGVDPAKNVAKVAIEAGIPTEVAYFNQTLAETLSKKGLKPALIYGANVLAHVPGIDDFVQGVKTLLPKTGRAVFEFPYLGGMFEGKFDTIYHEHVFYYSLTAVSNVFARAGLTVYDWELVNMQGGSLRIYIGHQDSVMKTDRCGILLQLEKDAGYTKFTTYKKLAQRIEKVKSTLMILLKDLRKQGKSVIAYSAPAKGVVLMNYFGINENYLTKIVDKAPQKQGLYVPGVHMVVESPDVIQSLQPDYVLILCWNIASEVIHQLKQYQNAGGKFILPIPQVKVV